MEKLDARPVKTAADHARAMDRVDLLMSKDDLPEDEARDLEELAISIEKYESEHFPVELPTLAEAIEFRIDQLGITRGQLADRIGFPRPQVSEVLNGEEKPPLAMIRALRQKLGIPADVLSKEVSLAEVLKNALE